MHITALMVENWNLQLICYVDAEFASLWNQKDQCGENCVKSRTSYVLCISNCPVLWISHLQEGFGLSTIEAEYVALSMAMRYLLPFEPLVQSIFTGEGIKKINNSTFYVIYLRKIPEF